MSVTHHRCPKQFRRCSLRTREHVVESSFDDPERDAAIGRKFNLWGAGCRGKLFVSRHFTPPVVLSTTDVMARLNTTTTKTWGKLTYGQKELIRIARRTLFELRTAAATAYEGS